ncbi:MAG: polysaccharide biosynthesis protein, partial [Proteobacteria bacterium]|nr:polysaccharide biosynthesis protein [Pseudomonadota bacterium]
MNNKASRAADSLREFLIGLSRPAKSGIAFTADLFGFSLCVLAAFWLLALGSYAIANVMVVAFTALVSVFLAWWQGMYRSVVRYMGLDLFIAGSLTAVGSALAGAILMNVFVFGGTPRRWAIAYALFSFLYICGSRYFARLFLMDRRAQQQRQKVIIYGGGAAGVELTMSLQNGNVYLPVAMLDDDPKLQGKKVKGLEVHAPSEIEALCRRYSAKIVLLAVPRAKHKSRRKILEYLSEFPVHVQTIPDFGDIVSGKARVDDISDVDVEDLLGRDPVPPIPQLLESCVAGKSVLVTGAAGSIGSELCRQLLALNPKRLVLLDNSEAALYHIDKELQGLLPELGIACEIVPLLGSVGHERRIREVMTSFAIQTVYHAAAYKHVPLVEYNIFEGIHNNVFGTMHTARAAMDSGVETFVLISTDKAVSPTSIMGATKRFAELILQAHNSRSTTTRFCMVRFGNVLESSGSVVPLFREQIRNGGPLTITHRDIIRYFMTIREAAELVIQAGSMARGGDVFVLDMGEPVRIQDLAYRMVRLMGLTVQDATNPDGDIAIQYIGLRPAEKLYEELLIGSNVAGTEHPRIMRADETFLPYDTLWDLIRDLEAAAAGLEYARARHLLTQAVAGY